MDGELQRISALPQKDKVKVHQAQLARAATLERGQSPTTSHFG